MDCSWKLQNVTHSARRWNLIVMWWAETVLGERVFFSLEPTRKHRKEELPRPRHHDRAAWGNPREPVQNFSILQSELFGSRLILSASRASHFQCLQKHMMTNCEEWDQPPYDRVVNSTKNRRLWLFKKPLGLWAPPLNWPGVWRLSN